MRYLGLLGWLATAATVLATSIGAPAFDESSINLSRAYQTPIAIG